MRRSYQYKASLPRRAAEAARGQLAVCCELYNACLQERRDHWRLRGVTITAAQQMAQLPEIKRVRPDLAAVGSQVVQDVVQRLDRAFRAFFRRVQAGEAPGYPRFKSRDRYDSLTFKQAGWTLGPVSASGKKRTLTLHGIGTVRLFWSRDMEGRVKTVTLRRDRCGDWWVTFSCDDVPEHPLPATGAVAGLDVGLEAFLTTSHGERVTNPRPLVAATAGLRKAQRVVSKRRKGGKRRRKAVRRLAKRHRRVERVRRDFHHKVARMLVQQYDVLAVEALNVRGLQRGMLARSVSDVAWGQFLAILSDKAAGAGRTVVTVDPRGTSQTCSACGTAPERPKALAERMHHCPCGNVAHRDVNAARNILARAIPTGRADPSASRPACQAAA
jgi:putative transposase